MDWPAGDIDKMTAVSNVYDAYSAYKSHSGTSLFAKVRPDAWQIVTTVWNMRKDADLNWFTGEHE